MITFLMKTVFIAIFFISAFSKIYDFNLTLIYFADITKLSIPVLSKLLWMLIFLELVIPILVLMNGGHSGLIFSSIMSLLIIFLITNVLFLFHNVDNCGCFGTGIQSTPTSGIIKIILLMIILCYLRNARRSKYSISS
jgi:hypothetical protein